MVSTNDILKVFEEVEDVATGASSKSVNVLKLLSEEMIGLTTSILGDTEASFTIKKDGKDSYELVLSANAFITTDKKREFIDASTKKENVSEKGIKGKIRSVFEDLLYSPDDTTGMYSPELAYGTHASYETSYAAYYSLWSMNSYLDKEESKEDEMDGLEKSILVNMSDDVIIGVNHKQIQMCVRKKF